MPRFLPAIVNRIGMVAAAACLRAAGAARLDTDEDMIGEKRYIKVVVVS